MAMGRFTKVTAPVSTTTMRSKKFKKNPKTMKSKVNLALRLSKKALKQEESKYSNQTNYATAVTTTFQVNALCQIAQGDTAVLRDGNKIVVDHITVRAFFESNAGSNITSCMVRMIVLQDLQQIGDSDINVGSVFVNGSLWNSNYNFPDSVGRFKIIYDETFEVTPSSLAYASAGATASSFNTNCFKKLKLKLPHPTVLFNGTATTDIQKNGVYMLLAKSNNGYTVTPDINTQVKFVG